MATREENLKKINAELEKLSDNELEQVAGGSWLLPERKAEKAGITLINDDGTPGSFGYFCNTGNYYWRGKKISDKEAYSIAAFVDHYGYQPEKIEEAVRYYTTHDVSI